MGKYVAESVTIASIWPGKLPPLQKYVGEHPRDTRGRCTTYELEPVPRGGKTFTLEVYDGFESVRDWIESAEQGTQIVKSNPVDCREIAENLVREWAGNFVDVPANAGLGIKIIRGSVPHVDELRDMKEELSRFANWQFQKAEQHARLNEWKEISETMRVCAKWLGQDRIWSEPQKAGELTACAACRETISSLASVCPKCGTKLKALPPELAALNEPVEATA